MVMLTFAHESVVFAAVSRLAEAGGHAQVGAAHLVLAARGVVAHDARVDAHGRGGRQPRDTWQGHGRRARRGLGRGLGLPLGDGDVGRGLDVAVQGDLLHGERGADDLAAVLGGLGGLEDLLAAEVLGGPHHRALAGGGGPGGEGSLGRSHVEVCPLAVDRDELVPGPGLGDDVCNKRNE